MLISLILSIKIYTQWSYRGHTLEWSRIRLLTKWDDTEIEYDASGIRTRKGDPTYELDGSSIISETTNGNTIRYYYGQNGIVGFRYNNQRYYYEKNLQGDITGIYDADGNLVGAYIYDAWGNTTITTDIDGIASANPFRYRSYYYDSETGLYYVASRYYDPEVGRFINADSLNYRGANRDLTGYNLFAYCGSNPINRKDSSGQFFSELYQAATTVIAETGKAMKSLSLAFAGCGGIAAADGLLPIGDVIGIAGVALLMAAAFGYGIYRAAQTQTTSILKTETKAETAVITKENDDPVIFPVNPHDFNPLGLSKVYRAGTKNGSFISWMDPITNIEVFRWDENPNYSNGPHYHIYGTGHYIPGSDSVPEPYASIYFPLR